MAKKVILSSTNRTNRQLADNFFKEIFGNKSSIRELLEFIGVDCKKKKMEFRLLDPVLIGNRQNDLSFLLEGVFYYFLEHQSTYNPNMPLRLLFYICQALEKYVNGEDLYKQEEIEIPEIKCYTLFTGLSIEEPKQLETVQKLSELYLTKAKQEIDLELCVHCFHMEATREEMKRFVEEDQIPERFGTIENIVVQYAMFVNMIRYETWKRKVSVSTQEAKQIVVETCERF